MGLDYQAPHATPYYSPCDGQALYVTDAHGGDGIYIKVTVDGQSYFVIGWHLCSINDPDYKPLIPNDNRYHDVKAGDLLGFTDNTGAPFESSGDHFHLGLVPLLPNGNFMYQNNGYGGAIDPVPYLLPTYAIDAPKPGVVLQALINTLQALVVALKGKNNS